MHGIDTDEGVLIRDLGLSELSNVFNWVISGVLSKGERDFLKSISEGSDGVLLDTLNFISSLGDGDRASELSGTTSSDNVGVLDHVTDDTDGIMEASSGFVANGLRSTSDHDGNGLGLLTLLNEDDLVSHGSERDFRDLTGFTKLGGGDFLESGDDSGSGGNSEELNFDTTDPSDGGKVVLHEEMVSFIIETPLAEDDVGAGVLDGLDHLGEVVSLHVL